MILTDFTFFLIIRKVNPVIPRSLCAVMKFFISFFILLFMTAPEVCFSFLVNHGLFL